MVRIELTTLRGRLFQLLSDALPGETFPICRQEEIISQLGTCSRPPIPDRPALSQKEPLSPNRSAMLYRFSMTSAPPHRVDLPGQLDCLANLHQALLERRKSANHRPWMAEPRRDVGHRTPVMALRGAWRPDNPLLLHISTLAKQASRD